MSAFRKKSVILLVAAVLVVSWAVCPALAEEENYQYDSEEFSEPLLSLCPLPYRVVILAKLHRNWWWRLPSIPLPALSARGYTKIKLPPFLIQHEIW
jgi:hypothetical protein